MDIKTKILKESLKLFIRDGFHGTSTAKITQAVGISNGTLFHHFKTKEDLINSLYLHLKEDYRHYLLKNIDTCNVTKKDIRELWFNCVNWSLINQDSIAFFEMFCHSPYINALSKEQSSRNFSFIIDFFNKAIADEIIIDVDANLIIQFVNGSIKALLNFAKNNPEKVKDNMDYYIDTTFKMWWKSVVNI